MANGHGGKRKGAGRPAGSRNNKTIALQQKAEELGVCPVEAMLMNIRYAMDRLDGWDVDAGDTVSELRDMIHRNAKDVAPYLYPKLATTTVEGGGDDGELKITITREIVG